MAVKDHSFDYKIIHAAEDEFLEQGFMAASMYKIADRAGITTGTLCTRYKSRTRFSAAFWESFSVIQSCWKPVAQKCYEVE